jgi:hypothetical protein
MAERTIARPRLKVPALPALLTFGVFGWLSFIWLAVASYRQTPPSAAFDLELLLQGGRHVAAGTSPYSADLIAGKPTEIVDLFYTYPPIVAQTLSLVAAVPSPVIFAVWVTAATIALGVVAALIARRFDPARPPAFVALAAVAVAPLWFPFTVGALFGNLDIFFPALYGLMLLAAMADVGTASERRRVAIAGGVALALASITKLHPALIGLWFLVRGLRGARQQVRDHWLVLAAAAVTGAVVLATSLVVGGVQPWLDYLALLRASANVDLLDHRNLGPVAQIVMVGGLGPSTVGPLQVVMLAIAAVGTIIAALRVGDPLESFAWATFASFVPMPVTWYHHFGALIPIGLAAALRARITGGRAWSVTITVILVSFFVAILGLGMPFTWLLLPLTMAAVRSSRMSRSSRTGDTP